MKGCGFPASWNTSVEWLLSGLERDDLAESSRQLILQEAKRAGDLVVAVELAS